MVKDDKYKALTQTKLGCSWGAHGVLICTTQAGPVVFPLGQELATGLKATDLFIAVWYTTNSQNFEQCPQTSPEATHTTSAL